MTPAERNMARLRLMLQARKIQEFAKTRCTDRQLAKAEKVLTRAGDVTIESDPAVINLARQVVHQRALRDDPNYLRDVCRVEIRTCPNLSTRAGLVGNRSRSVSAKKAEPARARHPGYSFDELLMQDHDRAMLCFPAYKEFIDTHGGTQRDREEIGLRLQKRRYSIGAKRRHRDIWRCIIAYDRSHAGPIVSPGNCVAAAKRRLTI